MAISDRYFPISGFNLDRADQYMSPEIARYLKNVVYSQADTSQTGGSKGSQSGMFKPLESVRVYYNQFSLPSGYNHFLGGFSNPDLNWALFLNYNENGDHGVYRINGESRTIEQVYFKDCLNFQLDPSYFIHEGGATLEIFYYTNPLTNVKEQRSYFMWCDAYNDFRFLCIEDSIATNSFDATTIPYFVNPHPECLLINAGVPKPKGCIKIEEVANVNTALQNNLKFHTWQFMVRYIDVYGRPSEWGDISDLYIPGGNDCIGSSNELPRCLNLIFDAGGPLVNIIEIAYRNCNEEQWYKDTSLFLYKGSNLGEWWLRPRNPDVIFNSTTNEITYQFCKDKECIPISQSETNRTENPMPKSPVSVAKIGKNIGLANGKDGFNPFGNDPMDEVNIEVIPPTDPSIIGTRKIEIYVPVINPRESTSNVSYEPIYNSNLPSDDGQERWIWGGYNGLSSTPLYGVNGGFEGYFPCYLTTKQYFADGRQGFIGYLAGTGNPPTSTISELYYVDEATNNFIKVDDFGIVGQVTNWPYPNLRARRYYNKFTFTNIAPAIYVFRIASSFASLSDKNFYNTSTTVVGQMPWTNKSLQPFPEFSPPLSSSSTELIIDVCENDYNSENEPSVLVIYDLTFLNDHIVTCGYIYGDKVNDDYITPIELLEIRNSSSVQLIQPKHTDHNGFYWGQYIDTTNRGAPGPVIPDFFGYCNGEKKWLVRTTGNANKCTMDVVNASISDAQVGSSIPCPDYSSNNCNYVVIKGIVTDCDSGTPIPGVGVVLSRGRWAITGGDGTFYIIAHDNAISLNGIRDDDIYFIPTICPFTGCNDICVESYHVNFSVAFPCYERIIDVPAREVRFETIRGLLSGGNYGVGIWGNDWLGRRGFVQVKNTMYFTTPTLIDTQVLRPSQIVLNIPPSATFPDWIDELSIGITKELTMGLEYITWIVDRVEFIDNSGEENNINPTQIKIYYGSLNEYNIQNNFNTTTHWQFIVQTEPSQINYTSDFVEFYINGDGNFFPTLTRELIKYDQTGQYFLINYNSALKDLQKYAMIRIGRPLKCSTPDTFFQLCGTVKVINGKAQQQRIVLNAFDTYYKYRQIPIPIEVVIPADENNPDSQSTIGTVNTIRSFGFAFEHNSPSDFWGEKCINIGKINSRNPFEAEIDKRDQVALSGALSVNGQLNYLNYFTESLKRNFDSWDFGGIISMLPQGSVILIICQNDAYLVGFNDNILRINSDGQVIVPSADSLFGNPQTKVGNNYGCILFDKNTIRSREGLVQYLCSQKAYLIQHNYDNPIPVSANIIDSWLRPKVKYIQEWNRTHDNKKYFTGAIDPAANAYNLTDFTIRSTEFVNHERGYDITKQETLSFDIYGKTFRVWFGFTPQGYVYLDTNLLEKQLFSFAKNNVYYHYDVNNPAYGEIYGDQVEKVIRFIAVIDPMKKKTPLMIANYCVQSKYFCDQILTDSGQQSRILLDYFKQGLFFSSAPFLCDLNTPADPNIPNQTGANKLTDGNKLVGSIVDIRLIGDPSKNTVYSEYLGSVVGVFGNEQSG